MPWFIGGDFNEVLNDGEKVGGNNRVPWQMTGFNSTLMNCDLTVEPIPTRCDAV